MEKILGTQERFRNSRGKRESSVFEPLKFYRNGGTEELLLPYLMSFPHNKPLKGYCTLCFSLFPEILLIIRYL